MACTILLLLLTAAPLGLPCQAELQPAAVLACVFFWSLFRPDSMPAAAVFLIGVLSDLLGLAPPGVSALILLLTHGLALKWRRALAGRSFLAVCLAFAAVAAGDALLQWAMTSLLSLRLLPGSPALFQFGLAAGLFPMLASLFLRANRSLANPDHA